MPKKTPPLHASGIYQLIAPWATAPNTIYSCKAIRTFKDIFELGDDVYTKFYLPLGVSEAAYKADVAAGANIITLVAQSFDPAIVPADKVIIYVPDTYIDKYPDQSNVPYSHMVLSVSMSAVPDNLSLTALKTQIANVCSNVIGVTPTVLEHRAPSSGLVTPADHATLEAARLGAISLRETDFAKAKRLEAEKAVLQQQLNVVTKILRDNNLLP